MIINRSWTLEDEILYRAQVDEQQTDAVSMLDHAIEHVERDGTDRDTDLAVKVMLVAQGLVIETALSSL